MQLEDHTRCPLCHSEHLNVSASNVLALSSVFVTCVTCASEWVINITYEITGAEVVANNHESD